MQSGRIVPRDLWCGRFNGDADKFGHSTGGYFYNSAGKFGAFNHLSRSLHLVKATLLQSRKVILELGDFDYAILMVKLNNNERVELCEFKKGSTEDKLIGITFKSGTNLNFTVSTRGVMCPSHYSIQCIGYYLNADEEDQPSLTGQIEGRLQSQMEQMQKKVANMELTIQRLSQDLGRLMDKQQDDAVGKEQQSGKKQQGDAVGIKQEGDAVGIKQQSDAVGKEQQGGKKQEGDAVGNKQQGDAAGSYKN